MQSNVVKKVVSFILAITMLMVSTAVFAVAPGTDYTSRELSVQPRWTFLYECDNSLSLTEGRWRKLTIYASTMVYEGHSGVSVQLQKLSSDGTRWNDVDDKYWEVYAEDIECSFFKDDVSVSAGTYRCSLEHMAFDENGFQFESFFAYTNEVTVY